MYEILTNLSRTSKRYILLTIDLLILIFTLYAAFALRFGTIYPESALNTAWPLFPIVTVLGLLLLIFMRLSQVKLEAFERTAIFRTGVCAIGLGSILSVASYITGLGAPRSIPIIFGFLFFVGSVSSRIIGQYILEALSNRISNKKRILIYGAGQAGIQLAAALKQTREVYPVAFIDDRNALKGLIVSGLMVLPSCRLEEIIEKKRVERVILAIPSLDDNRRIEILKRLNSLPCEVQTLPSFVEMIHGKGLVESLKPVSPDDLLGRDKVDLNLPDVARTYNDKSVLVTGAGGSIGSELCRQLILCGIRKLVLFDHSEYALYSIERELLPIAQEAGITLKTVLGSVTDAKCVEFALRTNETQIVLHAAAYKHVPLVETNEIAGLRNNVMGTRIVADAARTLGLEQFILISTDKAVRPTNVMGSSKRLAELIIQDFAARSKTTLFSMVRFGNVLGSSGSVIPLFKEQIAKGGPITLTHGEVTRYFMTIPEAARLVLLAGSFSRGGDVFVLDMGKPTKISDLARSMIELSGRTVRDADNPNGDIEISITGLRPGEKLYEELLIGGEMLTTPHSKILRAQEGSLSELEIAKAVRDLTTAFDANDRNLARDVIKRWVEGYKKPQISGA